MKTLFTLFGILTLLSGSAYAQSAIYPQEQGTLMFEMQMINEADPDGELTLSWVTQVLTLVDAQHLKIAESQVGIKDMPAKTSIVNITGTRWDPAIVEWVLENCVAFGGKPEVIDSVLGKTETCHSVQMKNGHAHHTWNAKVLGGIIRSSIVDPTGKLIFTEEVSSVTSAVKTQ
jgi:hypothetical protein